MKRGQTILHDEVVFFDSNGFQPGLHDVLWSDHEEGKARQSCAPDHHSNHQNPLTIGRLVVLNSDPTDIIQETLGDGPGPWIRYRGVVGEKLAFARRGLGFRF